MKKNAKSIWRRRENPKRERRTKNSNIWRKIRENLGDDDEKGRMTLAVHNGINGRTKRGSMYSDSNLATRGMQNPNPVILPPSLFYDTPGAERLEFSNIYCKKVTLHLYSYTPFNMLTSYQLWV